MKKSMLHAGKMLLVAFGAVAALLVSPQATAQSLKERIVGSWSLVSNYQLYQDGKKANLFSEAPKGNLMFDRNGRFSFQIYNPGHPKFAANNRMEGTADENKAAVQGAIAYYGTYSVNEKEGKVTYNLEYCSFPNWDGTSRVASVTVKGDELQQVSPSIPSSKGAYVPHLVWKRIK